MAGLSLNLSLSYSLRISDPPSGGWSFSGRQQRKEPGRESIRRLVPNSVLYSKRSEAPLWWHRVGDSDVLLDAGMLRAMVNNYGSRPRCNPSASQDSLRRCSFLVVLLHGLFYSWWTGVISKLLCALPIRY